ncbi:MAG: FAD-dependent oxidoreductase [Chloroflexota bacterium]
MTQPTKTEILIIGGGVIGACIAYDLSLRGRDVTLLESRDICAGSSHGNAGWVAVDHSIPTAAPGVLTQGLKWLLDPGSPFYIKPRLDLNLVHWLWQFQAACHPKRLTRNLPILATLNMASLALFETLADQPDLAFDYGRKGLLHLYLTEKGFEKGLKEAELQQACGIEALPQNRDEIQALEPAVRDSIYHGIYYPQPTNLRPDRLVKSLAVAAEHRGANICTHSEVIDFTVSGKHIKTVTTTKGVFVAEQVVLAAGAWSAPLARQLGFRLAVQPAKGYSFTSRHPKNCPQTPLSLTDHKIALTPMGDWFRFSSTLELSGLDHSINQRRLAATREGIKHYLPGMDNLDIIEIWRGFRPLTPDGLPIIGHSQKLDNLILATGHGMLGVTQGPITGKLVTQLIMNEDPDLDLIPFQPARFG